MPWEYFVYFLFFIGHTLPQDDKVTPLLWQLIASHIA